MKIMKNVPKGNSINFGSIIAILNFEFGLKIWAIEIISFDILHTILI